MLPAGVLLLSAGVGVLAGLLIGAIGVGGIIIVPILTLLDEIDIQTAIASAMLSYMGAGVIGLLMYARAGSIKWPSVSVLMVAAAPGAFTAAFILQYRPGPPRGRSRHHAPAVFPGKWIY